LGLKSKIATFKVQRYVKDYPEEPLTAAVPGVALSELWGIIGIAENALAGKGQWYRRSTRRWRSAARY
jgi:putative ABC transport system permease protein